LKDGEGAKVSAVRKEVSREEREGCLEFYQKPTTDKKQKKEGEKKGNKRTGGNIPKGSKGWKPIYHTSLLSKSDKAEEKGGYTSGQQRVKGWARGKEPEIRRFTALKRIGSVFISP